VSTTMTLLEWLPDSRAHIFGRCGHWVQIERAGEFHALVTAFLRERAGG
jgi:2-hydroxymuconate-semialdehyde hydrolase